MIFQPVTCPLAGVDLALAQIFFIISIVALALSAGLFIAIIYLLKKGQFFQETVIEQGVPASAKHPPAEFNEKIGELETRVNGLEGKIGEIEEKISTLENRVSNVESSVKSMRSQLTTILNQVAGIEKKIRSVDARLSYIMRSGKGAMKQPVFTPPMISEKEIPHIGELNSLGDLKLYVPQLQYAALITSQGYIVEKYGQLSEEPPKLLEVVKISEKFTNSREITIVRGDTRITIFHVGKSEDLDIYGILALKKDASESLVNAIQEAVISYFRKKYVS